MRITTLLLIFCFVLISAFGCETSSDASTGKGDIDIAENDSQAAADGEESEGGGDESEAGWEVDPEFEDLLPTGCVAEEALDLGGYDADYALLRSGDFTLDKNYYLLTLFEKLEPLHQALEQDAALATWSQARTLGLREAAASCGEDLDCHIDKITFTDEDRDTIASQLAQLVEEKGVDLAGEHLRPSGLFQLFTGLDDDELIEEAFRITVAGLHIAFNHNAHEMGAAALDQTIRDLSDSHPGDLLFYEPLMLTTAAVLEAQQRDEAGRYEPMAEGENAAAVAAIGSIDWDRYPYSLILVPGRGPEDSETILHPAGALRCDLAAERLAAGLAPLVLTSGGHVHPDRTPYAEAIEMKKYLMETHGLPESALLVDPHARHTTTNLRNAARLILRYGIPADKPVLVTTDMAQSLYIAQMLDARCMEELGYLPYRLVLERSVTDTCMLIDPTSLHAGPTDPLDP